MKYLLILFISILFISCEEDVFYSGKVNIENSTWDYKTIPVFTFSVQDTTKLYDILLTMKHSDEYEYQNVYLKFITEFPSGKSFNDKISIEMADKTGKWFGNCSRGKCTLDLVLQKNAFFNETGRVKISVKQFTRTNKLQGIHNLRLIIKEKGSRF